MVFALLLEVVFLHQEQTWLELVGCVVVVVAAAGAVWNRWAQKRALRNQGAASMSSGPPSSHRRRPV